MLDLTASIIEDIASFAPSARDAFAAKPIFGCRFWRPRETAQHFVDLRDTNRRCGICTRCRKRPIAASDTKRTKPGRGPSRCAECRDARRVAR